GGIYNSGQIFVTNSTLTGNYTTGFEGTTRLGGGIANSGSAELQNVTIDANSSETTGGGIANLSGGNLHFLNSVVANNGGGDCDGAITSLGHNIAGDSTCGFSDPGDMNSVDPMLDALSDNGG